MRSSSGLARFVLVFRGGDDREAEGAPFRDEYEFGRAEACPDWAGGARGGEGGKGKGGNAGLAPDALTGTAGNEAFRGPGLDGLAASRWDCAVGRTGEKPPDGPADEAGCAAAGGRGRLDAT